MWQPKAVKPVAGALLYTRYGLLMRFAVSLISGRRHGATDTSRTNGSGGDTRAPFRERNSERQTGRKTIDARLSKAFKVGGNRQLVLLWEAFNVTNSTNYTFFSNVKYRVATSTYDAATNTATVNLTEDTGFLVPNQASSTLFGPRDMQIGLKFLW